MAKANRAMDLLLSRASTDKLVDPAPEGEMLARILSTALCAADHGRMRPWRYAVITGKHRRAFADLLVTAMREMDPDVSSKKIDKKRERYASVPLTIVLGMDLQTDVKISVEEQVMAVAAGAMNILNALHFEGFGGIWVSGAFQNEIKFREALGFHASQRVAGFLQVGSIKGDVPTSKRASINDYYALWDGAPVVFGADR